MYRELIFRPLYNGLVGVMDLFPWADVGVAIIIFTVIVKVVLFPLSKSALVTQARMKEIEPETEKLKKQYANDRQAQALKLMEFYKEKGIRPFSGILLLLIQLPILFALISVFYRVIPEIQEGLLYSFVAIPEVKTMFLGLIDLTEPSLILALFTAVVQYLQLEFSLASRQMKLSPPGAVENPSVRLANSLHTQMKYLVPLLAFASIYWLIPAKFPQAASIIAIYWATSSLMTFLQELVISRKYLKKKI